MDGLLYELGKEYRRERLREAEKERMLAQIKRDTPASLRVKLFTGLGDLLVTGGLKLKGAVQNGV